MIVAQRKNIPDLLEIVKDHKKLLVLGCGTCVRACHEGDILGLVDGKAVASKPREQYSVFTQPGWKSTTRAGWPS